MTTGEKIKYLRTQKRITQGQLAELSGIHPVSIAKYETNKMQPQPPQLLRIADALGISYSAFVSIENDGLGLKTVGDLMGILIVLLKSNVLQISGERGKDFFLLDDTVTVKFNPLLVNYLEMLLPKKDDFVKLSLNDILLNIKGYRMFNDLLKWEKMNYMYQTAMDSYKDNTEKAIQAALNDLLETKEKIELELIQSNMMLVPE